MVLCDSVQTSSPEESLQAEIESLKKQLADAKAQRVASDTASQQQLSELTSQMTLVLGLLAETNQRMAAIEAAQQTQPPAVSPPSRAAPGPASSQPPPATWASAVRGTAPQQQQPRQPSARQPTGSPRPGLAANTSQQCCFVISGSQAELLPLAGQRGDVLAASTTALISERLTLPTGEVRVLDAFPLGKVLPTDPPTMRRRFFIRVERLAHADAIVANRHKLKGAQLAIFDELSPQELSAHRLLWPTYVEARKRGLVAQFSRSKLVVTRRANDGTVLQRFTIWP